MVTKCLLQASANIIRITKLVKGDIVKLFKDESYGDKMRYGIVLDIVNDGEKTFVQFCVYNKSYGDIKGEILVLSGEDKTYTIFPTTKEEMDVDFGYLLEQLEKDIVSKEKELQDKQSVLKMTKEFI